jgi:hypothetical protein
LTYESGGIGFFDLLTPPIRNLLVEINADKKIREKYREIKKPNTYKVLIGTQ